MRQGRLKHEAPFSFAQGGKEGAVKKVEAINVAVETAALEISVMASSRPTHLGTWSGTAPERSERLLCHQKERRRRCAGDFS